jgi:DNA gyrase subunit A
MRTSPARTSPPPASSMAWAASILAYRTGRGRMLVRAKEIEVADNGREAIIVSELPYQVNKARLIEKIAELVKEKKLEGISELRDESDKDGMRMVIEVKRGDPRCRAQQPLFSRPRCSRCSASTWWRWSMAAAQLLRKQILDAFVRHRREVVTRRTIFELRKARDRAHILEGLTVALANIDEMIELIKTSESVMKPRAHAGAHLGAGPGRRSLLAARAAMPRKPERPADGRWPGRRRRTSCPKSRRSRSWKCACTA